MDGNFRGALFPRVARAAPMHHHQGGYTMRRIFAWALGAAALGWTVPSAPAQYYGYPQYPAYGYAPAPAYRPMPAPYYTMPMQGAVYYGGGYAQPMYPNYRPAGPMIYAPRPNYYMASPPAYVVSTPVAPSSPAGEPVVTTPEATGKAPASVSSIPRAL